MPLTLPAPWTTAYPSHHGDWTVTDRRGQWGVLDPERGTVETVDPRRDHALPGLAPSLDRGHLVGYRVGRRAIVSANDRFLKIVRPRRLGRLVGAHATVASAQGPIATPDLVHWDPRGTVELTHVGGRSLHQLLRSCRADDVLEPTLTAVGSGLAAFHETRPPSGTTARPIDDPIRWTITVGRAEPEAIRELGSVASELPRLPPATSTLVHGDLHDKNVFVGPSGLGLIDLDGVGLGAPEDDLANLGVHVRLRALQARLPPQIGSERCARLYGAYAATRPIDQGRLEIVERHTWFRLACLYRYREAGRPLVPALLRLARAEDRLTDSAPRR